MTAFGDVSSMRTAEPIWGEAAEDHRMDRAEAGTGEHGDGRLGDHGHVDHDPIAFDHAPVGQCSGEA